MLICCVVLAFLPSFTESSKRKIPLSKGVRGIVSDILLPVYYLQYNKNLKEFSRQLRNHSTLGEVLLWQELRAGQVEGCKFNRQKPLGNYIVDFYCKQLDLVIEVDGESHYHDDAPIRDKKRQNILEQMGLNFLRFDDQDVKQNMALVLEEIQVLFYSFEGIH